MLSQAIFESQLAMGDHEILPLNTHVRVSARNDCYSGIYGEVVGHSKNMLGAPLVEVKLIGVENVQVFYRHELIVVGKDGK